MNIIEKIKHFVLEHLWVKMLLILVVFLVLGFIKPFGDYENSLITEIIGILLTILLIDYLWKFIKEKKWAKIKSEVEELLRIEAKGLFFDLDLMSNNAGVSFCDEEEINELFLDKLSEVSRKRFYKLAERTKKRIEGGDWHKLFIKRKEVFNNIELKYSKYFKPEVIKALIKIQRILRLIDLKISIANKYSGFSDTFFNNLEKYFLSLIEEINSLDERLNLFNKKYVEK